MSTVKELIAKALRAPTGESDSSAEAAWREHRKKLAALGEASAPLCRKRDEHSALVDRVDALRNQVAAAVQALKSARADLLNADCSESAVATAEKSLAACRAQLAEVEPKAEVAELALSRVQSKIAEITAAVAGLQRQAPALMYGVLRERLAAAAPQFQAALDGYLDALLEVAGIATACDTLMTRVPGAPSSGSGFLWNFAFPAPEHSSFAGMAAPRDISQAARQRAAEILAQLDA